MIKNENDFLGLLILNKDSENNVRLSKVSSDSGLTPLDISRLIDNLSKRDYIPLIGR